MTKLPFKILGVEHIAIAVSDIRTSTSFFNSFLGLEHIKTEKIKNQKVYTHIYDSKNSKIELLEAISNDSPITNFLKKRGEGIHHIAFKVDKLQIALNYLKDNGISLINETPQIGAEGFLIAFLHPKSTNGVLVELCESID